MGIYPGCVSMLLQPFGFCCKFWVGYIPVVEWSYLNRLHCIWNCILERVFCSSRRCWMVIVEDKLFFVKKRGRGNLTTPEKCREFFLYQSGNPDGVIVFPETKINCHFNIENSVFEDIICSTICRLWSLNFETTGIHL